MGCTVSLKACVGQHDDQSLGILVSRWDGDMLFGNKPRELWWGERLGSCDSQSGLSFDGTSECSGCQLLKRYLLDNFRLSGLLSAMVRIRVEERNDRRRVV